MRKLNNPFTGLEGYYCFGCSPGNSQGLRMEFFEDGESVICKWLPSNHFQGYSRVLHGGIQSTLLDEIASWVVFVKLKTSGVTTRLSVEFLHTVSTDSGEITLRSCLQDVKGRVAGIYSELADSGGRICSKARVEYTIFPEKLARKKLFYPGLEAFYS
ncbi:MAG: PaaI family thioesterase [Spirochaetales bacterium]|nr:MAG: PaaI family thioesterase [Spirochaetales bacterium]